MISQIFLALENYSYVGGIFTSLQVRFMQADTKDADYGGVHLYAKLKPRF